MNKTLCFLLGCFMTVVMTLCSCDNSRNYVLDKQYTGEELSLVVSDSVMHGCTVTMYVDEADYSKIEIEGAKVDLSDVLLKLIGELSLTKAAPKTSVVSNCILPGCSKIVLENVFLRDARGGKTFVGEDVKSEFCKFSFKGEVKNGKMSLRLYDVKMNNALPLPGDKVKQYPIPADFIKLDWQYNEGERPSIAIIDILNMKQIPLQLSMLLSQSLQAMTIYKSSEVTLTLAEKETRKGAAQYVLLNDKDMRVFLNIPEIVSTRAGGESDIQSVIESIVPILGQYLAKMVNEGILMHYSISQTGMTLILDSAPVMKIMNLVSIALSSEKVIAMLGDLLKSKLQIGDAELAQILAVIQSLPENLNATKELNISFNFSYYPANN